MPPPAHESPEFLPYLPLIILGGFLGVTFLISLMGWRWFARKYPAKVRPEGRANHVPSANFGGLGGYRNVVRVVFTAEGIYFTCCSSSGRFTHPSCCLGTVSGAWRRRRASFGADTTNSP